MLGFKMRSLGEIAIAFSSTLSTLAYMNVVTPAFTASSISRLPWASSLQGSLTEKTAEGEEGREAKMAGNIREVAVNW